MTHIIDCGTFADLIDLSRNIGERLVFEEPFSDLSCPVIKKIFSAAARSIQLHSNGVMKVGDISASMNPVTAEAFATSKEVWAYCAQAGFPKPALPGWLYGLRMEIVTVRSIPDTIALPTPDGPPPEPKQIPFMLANGQIVFSAGRTDSGFRTEFQFQIKNLFA